ncbi:MAG: TatD family deoxyribonuclease, partial [Crenarchaeota archaeon]|nr:TatD family deoxyribonuclease [Thermoproteota archaeon]
MFRLVDAHAHLEDLKDLEGAIRRAADAGVVAVITVGSDYDSSLFALKISKKEDCGLKVYPALGVHPWNISQNGVESTLDFIESKVDEAVGIGEVGLDYWYKEVRKDLEKKRLQREVFEILLKTAKRHNKPVIIHSRGAWKECVDMAVEAEVEKAVFHWFTGPIEVLRRLLEQGYFVSATPAAEYSREHRNVIENTPLENLLLETDSPVNYHGVEAEPAHVTRSLEAVA